MKLQITGQNGKKYTVRFKNKQLEIETIDDITGLSIVYVMMDISIGNYNEPKREAIVYSYKIAGGQRIDQKRHIINDSPEEFKNFWASQEFFKFVEWFAAGFLKQVEFTQEVSREFIEEEDDATKTSPDEG